ncbi:hypothetical protein [Arthrobacter sp. JCM 19049]|nr:hypothetical protein [Arthrobacter sp. JCM 19049]
MLYRQLRHRVPVADRAEKAEQLRAAVFSERHPFALTEAELRRVS